MNPAIRPVNLFCTPSSCSISSSARLSASSLISAAGWWIRASSSLMRGASVYFDALLAVVLQRPWVERNRRRRGLLILELDVLRLLVHADQIVSMLEHRLHDVVGRFLVHVLVRHQQVHDGGLLVVGLHAAVGVLRDHVLYVQVAVLLVHRRHQVGVIARSVIAAVGRPPTQKKASILRSLIALTDSATPSRSRFMSRSLSSPAASMTRNAITSVALPPEPVETRLPFRSFMVLTPVPSIVTTCIRLGYMTIRVRIGTGLPVNLSWPLSASSPASAIVMPR